jgi:hypothetical protein
VKCYSEWFNPLGQVVVLCVSGELQQSLPDRSHSRSVCGLTITSGTCYWAAWLLVWSVCLCLRVFTFSVPWPMRVLKLAFVHPLDEDIVFCPWLLWAIQPWVLLSSILFHNIKYNSACRTFSFWLRFLFRITNVVSFLSSARNEGTTVIFSFPCLVLTGTDFDPCA